MSTDTEKETKPPLKSASSSTLPILADGEQSTEKNAEDSEKGTDDTKTSMTVKSEGEAEQETGKEKGDTGSKGKEKAEAEKPGLLVTPGLLKVIEECKTKVETIAKECRASNTKYRDLEFDMLNEAHMCLYSVKWSGIHKYPSDKQRVTEVFESPTFFKSDDGNPSSDDIHQGALGDCWFLCALATISNLPHLVQQVCVAKDEEVGVYGQRRLSLYGSMVWGAMRMRLHNEVLVAAAHAKQSQSSRRVAVAMADAKRGDDIKLTTEGG